MMILGGLIPCTDVPNKSNSVADLYAKDNTSHLDFTFSYVMWFMISI